MAVRWAVAGAVVVQDLQWKTAGQAVEDIHRFHRVAVADIVVVVLAVVGILVLADQGSFQELPIDLQQEFDRSC